MNLQQFKDELEVFAFLATEYCAATSKHITHTDDLDDVFRGHIEITLPSSERVWVVPVGTDLDGDFAIVACENEDCYLVPDAGGLYAWLWLEAEKIIRDMESK